MNLLHFTTLTLQTQSKILRLLSETFGSASFLKVLEQTEFFLEQTPVLGLHPSDFESTAPHPYDLPPFQMIHDTLKSLQISYDLEFYLLSYPFYRALIESSIDLNSKIPKETALHLTQAALKSAEIWNERLCISENSRLKLAPILKAFWLKFRTDVLKFYNLGPLVLIQSNPAPLRAPSSSGLKTHLPLVVRQNPWRPPSQ